MKKIFPYLLIAIVMINVEIVNAQSWNLTGNSGTQIAKNFVGTKDNIPLVFRTKNIEQMRIDVAGYVGIGIKKPLARLHVDNGPFVNLSSPGCFQIGAANAVNLGMDYSAIQARNNGAASRLYVNYFGGDVWIGSHNAVTTPAIYASVNGSVGIGNSAITEGYALTVNTNATLSGINVVNPGTNPAFYSSKSGAGNVIDVSKTSTSSNSATIYCSNSGSGWAIQAEANLGDGVLGYSANGFGVYAYGNDNHGVYAYTGNNAVYYAGYFVGDVYSTTGVFAGSDQKLKQNIKDFTSALDIINQLQPKQYQFRHDGNYKLMNLPQGEHYGLIAQEVEKILPNLVKDSKFETPRNHKVTEQTAQREIIDFKALNYTELIPIIIKGMQELNKNLQAQINEQENRIKKLENVIEKLTANSNASSLKLYSSENSTAYLRQNAPNPFTQNAVIKCNVPSFVKQAQLIIYNEQGSQLKSFALIKGINNINIVAGLLPSGQYVYSLVIDGKNIDSKKMILAK